MDKFMQAVVIDPKAETVELVPGKWDLAELQAAVGGYIEDGGMQDDHSLYCNEEALLSGEPDPLPAFIVPGITKGGIIGKAVYIGANPRTGESTTATHKDLVAIRSAIRFGKVVRE